MSGQKLVIAEKPSVASALSAVLGAKERGDGYYHGNGYIVSWCYGHLVELAQPDAYDEKYGKWRYEDLPIIPSAWKYDTAKGKAKQLKVLSGLMKRADVDTVINACDAGREGELIFRAVYEVCKCKKPVKRLWISSMEDTAIRAGFANLKGGADYDNLYASALCRSQADWIVGLNATRLFSVLYNCLLSVGRVQSPTLAMLVQREAEIAAFVKEPFYIPEIHCGGFKASGDRLSDKAAAEAIRQTCEGKAATVTAVERGEKSIAPPKLYDLTALQRDANRLLGYTAQQTLDYAQSLYEKKLLSYPRTDSRYLTSDMADGLADFIGAVGEKIPFVAYVAHSVPIAVEPVINDGKVSDHHAIIPTKAFLAADLGALPVGERDLLFLAAVRLIAATAPKHVYEAVTVTLACAGQLFTAKGKTVIEDGWSGIERAYKASLKGKSDEGESTSSADGEDAALPALTEGQVFEGVAAALREGFTAPPKSFTEDTLLSAMENAGAEDMPDEAERRGLGTPATRASIIEKIIKGGFVKRDKKKLIPTDKGKGLIAVLPEMLTSPKLTANWESKLLDIQRGQASADTFLSCIADMTQQLVESNTAPLAGKETLFAPYAKQTRQYRGDVIGTCPRCGASVREGSTGFFCDNDACGWGLWRDAKFFVSKKKELTKPIAAALLKDGRVSVKGLYSEKTGKSYDAVVVMDDTGEKYVGFKLEFAKR